MGEEEEIKDRKERLHDGMLKIEGTTGQDVKRESPGYLGLS